MESTRIYKSFKSVILSKQPSRFIAKSLRNIFFPTQISESLQRTVFIEVSNICNAKCIFCSYKFGYRQKRFMALGEFKNVAESCVRMGYENLDLTSMGGELFIHSDAINVIKEAKRAGFKHIGTYTNAILIYRYDVEELLRSGIDVLIISFPGFDKSSYQKIFQVNKYQEFKTSLFNLLKTHKIINSNVKIIFEPRTYMTKEQIEQSELYTTFILNYIGKDILIRNPLRVFDTWSGAIKKKDMVNNMKVDISPIKSIYPLKKVYLCTRILILGILSNSDVRLCNCRYDETIETNEDGLYIDNIKHYKGLEELVRSNKQKIINTWIDFLRGEMPELCKRCSFYSPVKVNEEKFENLVDRIVI